MKKLVISLTTIVIVIFLCGNVYSQSNFFFHAGPSIPLSDFGDDDRDDDDSGGAGVGLNLGGKYIYKLNDKGLGLYLGADFIFNGLQSDVKEDTEDEVDYIMGANVDIKHYKYINIPVTAGINYTFKANEEVSLFADLGIGADFFKVTKMTLEISNEDIEYNFDLSTQLAFKIGGGLLIQDKYIIGLNYNVLGDHNIKWEMEYDGDTQELDDLEQKVDVLTVIFGIKF